MGKFQNSIALENSIEQPQTQQIAIGGTFGGIPLEKSTVEQFKNQFDTSDLQPAPDYVPQSGWRGAVQKVTDVFTGDNRREFDLPEIKMPFELSGRYAKTAIGLASTFNKKREMNLLKKHYPNLKFAEDKFKNIIVDGSEYKAGIGYLNAPGVSLHDIKDYGFQLAAFTPAGKVSTLATNLGGRLATAGITSALTETGIDLGNQKLGGTDDTSLGNVSKSNVAIAGIGGSAFEGLGMLFSKYLLPATKSTNKQPVTDEIRRIFRPIVAKTGQDPTTVTDDTIRSAVNDMVYSYTNSISRNEQPITTEIREVFKAAASKTGQDPTTVTDDAIRSTLDNVIRFRVKKLNNVVDPVNIPAIQDTSELNIPYTQGQASGNVRQLQLEDRLRNNSSESAASTLERFATNQNKNIIAARDQTQRNLASNNSIIATPAEAGEAIIEGTRMQANQALRNVDEAYSGIGSANLTPEGQKGLLTHMKRIAKVKVFENAKELAPSTYKTLNDIAKLSTQMDAGKASLRSIPMRRLETLRKQLNNRIDTAPNLTDKRQMVTFKQGFDDYLTRAIDQAMFTGDQKILAKLKVARGLHSDFMKKFTRQDTSLRGGYKIKDAAGEAIQRIVEYNPTNEEVINYVFGLKKIGGHKHSAKLLKNLKNILGEHSKEWSAVRQAGFFKLTDSSKEQTLSGAKFLANLAEANKNSPTTMKILFNKKEIAQMKRLAYATERAQPSVIKYGNVSRSGHKVTEYASNALEKLLVSLGFTTGGPQGALAGKGAFEVSNSLSNIRASLKAKQAVQGAPRPLERLSLGQYGAPISVDYSEN